MSGIRQSFLFAYEPGKYAEDKNLGDYKWIAPPPGSFLNTQHNRAVQKVFSAGNKTFDTYAFGAINGSFEWTFLMDYNYLEPLKLVFEEYKYNDGVHTFSKCNNLFIPSFAICRKVLNQMTPNGGNDEMELLRGCVVRNMRVSRNSSGSQMSVTLTGFYSNEKMVVGSLSSTDYQAYNGKLVEYTCMFFGDENGTPANNVDSLALSVENGSDAIRTPCRADAVSYYENQSSYAFSVSAYSNDPAQFKQRLYSGGVSNTDVIPRQKGMAPISKITLVSYDGGSDHVQDYAGSVVKMKITIEDCVIKSLTWQKGDGQKLQDQISSTDCKNISFEITNKTVPNLAAGSYNVVVTVDAPTTTSSDTQKDSNQDAQIV